MSDIQETSGDSYDWGEQVCLWLLRHFTRKCVLYIVRFLEPVFFYWSTFRQGHSQREKALHIILVTSDARHGVANHGQLDGLFNNLLKFT